MDRLEELILLLKRYRVQSDKEMIDYCKEEIARIRKELKGGQGQIVKGS